MHGSDDFEDFYQASYGRIVSIVAAFSGNRAEAEDIAQEAYARALARWSRLRDYDMPEAWVRRVALRIAVDSRRRIGRALAMSARAGSAQVLREYSALSGRLLFAVTIGTTQALDQSPDYCGVLWASADGADLLTQCGTRQLEITDGNARAVRLARIVPASAVGWADSYAW